MEGGTVVEKTAEELRKELEELKRQQWEITERLRDPRGIRRAGLTVNGPRANGIRQRGVVRPAERVDTDDEPSQKRRLSSAVVKIGEEPKEEAAVNTGSKDGKESNEGTEQGKVDTITREENGKQKPSLGLQMDVGHRRNETRRPGRLNYDVPPADSSPRVLPKNEDPSLVKRNRRMLGQLLGTLEKFREEDKQLSSTEAYMRRSDSLRRAEQRAREESERLRQQEREQMAEKRRRDLMLRARVAAKAEEKKLELLFLQWADHQKKLGNFIRTKTHPPIYYLPKKPSEDDATSFEKNKEQVFLEWKSARRAELNEYQKRLEEQYIANVEMQLERWQKLRNARKTNNFANLQESMDKELETHQLEHGPKTRRIPGSNEEEEDMEDIAEDDMMDDVLVVDENRRAEGDVGNVEVVNDDETQVVTGGD